MQEKENVCSQHLFGQFGISELENKNIGNIR
jgi:hypothetical protein